jgi:hypothetical protein
VVDDFSLPAGALTAVFGFEIGGMFVRGDQLGVRLETERDGKRIWVETPGRDRTGLGKEEISGRRGDPDDPGAIFRVEIIHVGVSLGDERDPKLEEKELLDAAEPLARKVVRDLLDWARTQDRQPWLPPPHVEIPFAEASWLENEAGERSRGVGEVSMVIVVFSDDDAPGGDLTDSLAQRELDEAASLLAEARREVWPGRDGDTKRAVLLAAIALEVKASKALLVIADECAQPLVELLLADEPSINRVLNKIAPAVGGESLKEHDGRLSKGVIDLVKLRNDVAHRGKTPIDKDALTAVGVVEEVFVWLDGHESETSFGVR